MMIPLSVETRRTAAEADAKWSFKAVLRVLATLFSLIAMALFAAAIAATNSNFVNLIGNGDWTDGLALAPVVISLLYNPITLIMNFVVRKGNPLHPAFHVMGDLIIWGMSVPALIFAVAGGMFWYWTSAIADDKGLVDCNMFFNAWSMECSPVAYTIGHMQIAGVIFLFFTFLIHLILFVFACMDLHRRRVGSTMPSKQEFDMEYPITQERKSISRSSSQ